MASNAVKAMPSSERYSSSSYSSSSSDSDSIQSIPQIRQTTKMQPVIVTSESETYLDYYGNPYGPWQYSTSNQAAELID